MRKRQRAVQERTRGSGRVTVAREDNHGQVRGLYLPCGDPGSKPGGLSWRTVTLTGRFDDMLDIFEVKSGKFI